MPSDITPQPGPSLVARRPRLTLALFVALGVLATWWLQAKPPPWRTVSLTPVVQAALKDDGGPAVGPRDADVLVVVFTDYQCSICKRTDGALDRLIAADPSVRVVYKDWPILGEASVDAARVALAADRQGRYVAVHRALMASRSKLDVVTVRRIAVEAGASLSQIEADLRDHRPAIDARLERQAAQAWSLGLKGSPGYLVGPYLVNGGLDDRALVRAVAAARKSGPPT